MNNPKTTWTGIIKIVLGFLATILTANSVTIVDGAVRMSPDMAVWLIIVAVLFTLLSGLQAILTKDADKLPPSPL